MQVFLLMIPDTNNNPWSRENRVRAPDGTEYVVRVAIDGLRRCSVFGSTGLLSTLRVRLRKKQRGSAEVFRMGRLDVEEPPIPHTKDA